jgi:UDP-GlcNAc3NAcA epimerase
LTLREQTEWKELIDNGCNQLVELENEKILQKINDLINKPFVFFEELYGDGRTAEKIIQLLIT